jgi:very-short-patch-repair endonuclease
MTRQRAIDHRISLCAAAQHGILARRQLVTIGLPTAAIDARVRAGRLLLVRRGVYALGHAELRREGRLLAAVFTVGPDAALSHQSAAALWGLRPWAGTFIELTVRSHRGRRKHRDLRVHRSTDLPPTEVTSERAIPVTTVARTILDLAAVVPAHHLRRAVERSEQLELFDLRKVERVIDAHPRHAGRRPLTALLDDVRHHGLPTTRSDVEAAFLQLCLDHGLPRPEVNRSKDGSEVDFRWPAHHLIVEVDGWAFHHSRNAFRNDRARDRAALRAGWRVARFPAIEVLHEPAAVATDLLALLARAP